MPSFNIDHKRAALKQVLNGLPQTIGTLAVSFSKDRFRAGGWYGTAFVPWKKRRNNAKRNKGRAILVDTGRLRRSIRISKMTSDSVTIGTDVPYARVHNEGATIVHHARTETFVRNRYKKGARGQMFGGMGAFKKGTTAGQGQTYKAHSVRMPQRQFLGESAYLNRIVGRKITTEIIKALQ